MIFPLTVASPIGATLLHLQSANVRSTCNIKDECLSVWVNESRSEIKEQYKGDLKKTKYQIHLNVSA